MDPYFLYVIAAGLGLLTGFTAPMTGAGGLIMLPSLLFMGLPPHTAIGTSRFSAVTVWIGAYQKLEKSGKIVAEHTWPLIVMGIIGGVMGSLIALEIPEALMKTLIAAMILLVAIILLFQKDLGIERTRPSPKKKYIGYVLYFFVSIYAGFLGSGSGAMSTVLLMVFMGLTITETKGTEALPKMTRNAVSILPFALTGHVNWPIACALGLGSCIGGWLGTHIMLKIGDVWVKRVFIVASIIMAAKLLLDNI